MFCNSILKTTHLQEKTVSLVNVRQLFSSLKIRQCKKKQKWFACTKPGLTAFVKILNLTGRNVSKKETKFHLRLSR